VSPELPKDPGKRRFAGGPVGKQPALLAVENGIWLQQGRHNFQGRRSWELGEAKERDPQGFGAGVQGTQGFTVEFALVGPPEALVFPTRCEQRQARALVAPNHGQGLMEYGLVVEAPLALQGHDDREAA
jgi:hypothetical protein